MYANNYFLIHLTMSEESKNCTPRDANYDISLGLHDENMHRI